MNSFLFHLIERNGTVAGQAATILMNQRFSTVGIHNSQISSHLLRKLVLQNGKRVVVMILLRPCQQLITQNPAVVDGTSQIGG